MQNEKVVKFDLDGYEVVKDAILEIINQSPLIEGKEPVSFGVLEETHGFAMIPVSSSVIESTRKSVTGKVTEVCYYPFSLVYRGSGMNERKKSEVSELLDNIGKYLEKKEIDIDGVGHRLKYYPLLTENRKFLEIRRQTPSYLANVYEDKTEDWEIRITARYENVYRYDEHNKSEDIFDGGDFNNYSDVILYDGGTY